MITAVIIALTAAAAYYNSRGIIKGVLELLTLCGLVLLMTAAVGATFVSFLGAWAGVHAIYFAVVRHNNGQYPFDDSNSTLGNILREAWNHKDAGKILYAVEILFFLLIAIF